MALIAYSRHSRLAFMLSVFASLAALAVLASAASAHAEPRQAWPSRVHAIYRIDFNGFDIGAFEFNADINGQSYALRGETQLSALLGAFKWRSVTQSAGLVTLDLPRPAGYTFDFAGTGKSGSVQMGFSGDAVSQLMHVPAYMPQPGTIPVREPQLKGVFDPLSAVLALSRSPDENPCGRRLPIFDGKHRFDLTLTYLRQERVAETRPSGQPGHAHVCRVRYVPIAGHRMNEETRALAASAGVEIWLRPVPSANLFIPHQITVPTGAGPATLTSQRVDIVTTRNEQIALIK